MGGHVKRTKYHHQPCPDGGWGWAVVFGSFMLHVVMDGVIYTFGLFFYAISQYYGSTKAATSMVASIMNSVTYCSGPIASALTVKYGCRAVTIAGALLAGAGFALSVFAESIYQLYFPIGILAGLGFGLMYLPAIVIVTTWFEKRRSFATGIAVAGSGIGTMGFSPLIGLMIDHLTWQNAMLIVAVFLLSCALFGCLFRPVPTTVSADDTESKYSLKCGPHSDSHSLRSPHPMDRIDEENESPLSGEGLAGEGQQQHAVTPAMVAAIISASSTPSHKEDAKEETNGKLPETSSLACIEALLNVPETVVSLSSHPRACAKSLCSVEFNTTTDEMHEFGTHSRTHSRPHSVCPGILDRKDIFYTGSIMNLATDDDFENNLEEEADESEESEDESSKANLQKKKSLWRWFTCPDDMLRDMSKMVDLKLLRNNIFLLFAVSNFLTSVGYHIPFIFLKDRMVELGVAEESEAANFNAVIGLASTLSRLFFGYIADHQLVRRLTLYNVSITVCGVVIMATPFATTSTLFYAFCAVFGCTAGIYVSLTSVVLTDLLGLEKLTNAFGLILLFQGVASLVGPPIIGVMYDVYGNYDGGFVFTGAIIAISGIMLFFIDLESYFKSLKRLLRFK